MMKNIIRLGLTLGAFVLVVTALLAGTNSLTRDIIEKNQQRDEDVARAKLIEADSFEKVSDGIYGAVKSGEVIGYCVNVAPSGYGGEIKMIVAFDKSGAVVGNEIISMSETPGFGSKIGDEDFKAQFRGKKPPLALGSGGISAITGATISSSAAVRGFNDAFEMLKEGGLIN